METILDFTGVASAIGISVALALWIEWLSLRGLMRLMPARTAHLKDFAVTSAERNYRSKAA
ncbi:MAG TPA: hypothetical protein VKS44_07670 [Candidatus Acidoferrales bacterium]|nr:hypothetical protein [Candidatus Acidoferrales bacterium]